MQNSINDTIQNIRSFRKQHDIAKSRLALMAGVSEGITRNMDDNEWNPTASTLRKIEKVVNNFIGKHPKPPVN